MDGTISCTFGCVCDKCLADMGIKPAFGRSHGQRRSRDVRKEFAVLFDRLFGECRTEGPVDAPNSGMDFWDNLYVA